MTSRSGAMIPLIPAAQSLAGSIRPSWTSNNTNWQLSSRLVWNKIKYKINVKQEIFACRKILRFSQISRHSRNFPAHKYYSHTVEVLPFHHDFWFSIWSHHWKALDLEKSEVREIFLSQNSRRRDFVNFSCREIFLFYNTPITSTGDDVASTT